MTCHTLVWWESVNRSHAISSYLFYVQFGRKYSSYFVLSFNWTCWENICKYPFSKWSFWIKSFASKDFVSKATLYEDFLLCYNKHIIDLLWLFTMRLATKNLVCECKVCVVQSKGIKVGGVRMYYENLEYIWICCRILFDKCWQFKILTRVNYLYTNDLFDYRPQKKLREGNVFTSVCHSVHSGRGSAFHGQAYSPPPPGSPSPPPGRPPPSKQT